MQELYGREPTVDRRSLAFWMVLNLVVAALLLWLGLDLNPPGQAASIQTLPASPIIGAMGFAYLLAWAAFAYGIAISTPHDGNELVSFWLTLVLPLAAVLALDYHFSVVALILALGWLAILVYGGLRVARRQPLAGLMFLPLVGSAVSGVLLALTYWTLG